MKPADPRPVGQIQTDTFCEGCGYNLYSQAVIRDERLGIPVCRCPECGRFAAAGVATDAARPWLRRAGAALLLVYMAFLLGVFTLATLAMWTLQVLFLRTWEVSPWRWVNAGDTTFALREIAAVYQGRIFDPFWLGLSFAAGLATGAFLTTFLWHWKRRWALPAILVPLVIAVPAYQSWAAGVTELWEEAIGERVNAQNRSRWPQPPSTLPAAESQWQLAAKEVTAHFGERVSRIRIWGAWAYAARAGAQAAGIALGLLVGRLLARGMLRVLLPPSLRTYFAPLWIVDGKPPPAAVPPH